MLDIKKLLTKMLVWIKQISTVQTASGSVTVNANQYYTIKTLSLAANKKYLLLGHVAEGAGTTITSICRLVVSSGTASLNFGADGARTSTSSGQGVSHWKYVETGNGAISVAVQCYGYYTTSHTATGYIMAVCLGDI